MKKLINLYALLLFPFLGFAQYDLGCEEAIAFEIHEEFNLTDKGRIREEYNSYISSKEFREDYNKAMESSDNSSGGGLSIGYGPWSVGGQMDSNKDNSLSTEEQSAYINENINNLNTLNDSEWYRTEGKKIISHKTEAIKAWLKCKEMEANDNGIVQNFEPLDDKGISLGVSFKPAFGVNEIHVTSVDVQGANYNKEVLKVGTKLTSETIFFKFFIKEESPFVSIDIYTDNGGSISYFYNIELKELEPIEEIDTESGIDIIQAYPQGKGVVSDEEPRFFFTKGNNVRGWSLNNGTASCILYSESKGTFVQIGKYDGQSFSSTREIQLSKSDNIAGWNWDGKKASYLVHDVRGTVLVIQDFNGSIFGDDRQLIISKSDIVQGWTWDGKTARYLVYDTRGVVLVAQKFDGYNFGEATQSVIDWPDKNSWLLLER